MTAIKTDGPRQPPVDRVRLAAKLVYLNPGGSVNDRIGVAIVRVAEAAGELRPGGAIMAATTGNTGIGPTLAAAFSSFPNDSSEMPVAYRSAISAASRPPAGEQSASHALSNAAISPLPTRVRQARLVWAQP